MAATAGENPINLIALAELRDEYGSSLAAFFAKEQTEDVLIQFAVEVDVSGKGNQLYEVMLGVTYNYLMAEPVANVAEQLADPAAIPLFAWVPAHLFGTDEFSVYVSEHELGENLAHGLIGEVIREAQIEQTLANHKAK